MDVIYIHIGNLKLGRHGFLSKLGIATLLFATYVKEIYYRLVHYRKWIRPFVFGRSSFKI